MWAHRQSTGTVQQPAQVPSVFADPMTCESLGSCDLESSMAESDDVRLTSGLADPDDDGNGPAVAVQIEDSEANFTDSSMMRPATPSDVEAQTNGDMELSNDISQRGSESNAVTLSSSMHNGSSDSVSVTLSAPYKRLEHPVEKSLFLSCSLSLLLLFVILLLFGPAVLLYVVFLPLAWLVRSCIACCCCCSRNRACACCCSQVLTASENFWLHDSPFNKMVVQALLTLEEGLSLSQIRELVVSKLVCAKDKNGRHSYPRFTQKVVPLYMGNAWIKDPDFVIDNHVMAVKEVIRNQTELEKYIASQASVELDKDRPLWEIHVLCSFSETRDTLLLLRMHPCMSDGISLMRVLVKSLVDNPMALQLKPRFGQSAFAFNFLRAVFVGPLVFLHKLLFTSSDRNPLNISANRHLSGRKVVAISEPFSMENATRIKQVTRSTLNDVLLTVAAGSLRRYLQRLGVPNPYDLNAIIPIDLRSDDGRVRMGWKLSLMDFPLPTNTEGTIPRLWEIKQRMDELKNSADPVVMHYLIPFLSLLLPQRLYQRVVAHIFNKATCFVSTLPGPEQPVMLEGRNVKSVIYWAPPWDNAALSVSFITYADQVWMTVISDLAIVPDPQLLTRDFTQQVKLKLKAIIITI